MILRTSTATVVLLSVQVLAQSEITPSGLINPKVRSLTLEQDLRFNIFPFLSAAAYEGNGTIYLGVTTGGVSTPGVLTADFTERPLHFAVTNATVAQTQVGNIAVTGNVMVIAQYPNQIGVFRIKKDGSLTLLSTTTIDEPGEGMFFSIDLPQYAIANLLDYQFNLGVTARAGGRAYIVNSSECPLGFPVLRLH